MRYFFLCIHSLLGIPLGKDLNLILVVVKVLSFFPYFSSHSLRCEAVLLIPLSPDPLHAALFETNELDLSIAIST